MARRPGPRAGLPRGERLRGAPEFERVFRRGARVERPAFVVLWISEAGPRAVGFAAGRRLGGSVERNRARRRLREAYRHSRSALPCAGLRLCLVARRPILETPFSEVLTQMQGALRDVARSQGRS